MTTNNPYDDPRYGGYEPQYPGYDPHYRAYDPQYDPRYAQYPGYYGAPMPPPAPKPPRSSRRRTLLASGIATIAAAAVVVGVGVAESGSNSLAGAGSAQLAPTGPGSGSGGIVLPGGGGQVPGGTGGTGGTGGSGGGGSGTGGSGNTTGVGIATDTQKKGVVTVVSVLKYQNAESAGTGMILTSDGEILTNNHVVNGATSITVTVASSGKSYRADVVGTDPTDDVAVLQLANASGLTTANVGDSSDVAVGDKVVGVGNAGGTGTLRASAGSVTALNQSITATDESGQDGEKLTGLIEVNAPIISGDSGGPLYDSSGDIVGMDTAASANQAVSATAYAIPIDSAIKIATQIETKVETSKIHIGLPPFLGIELSAVAGSSATVEQAIGNPAAAAGINTGSVITAVGSKRVTSAASLKTALAAYRPGNRVAISWTDAAGSSHTSTLTLAAGPAD